MVNKDTKLAEVPDYGLDAPKVVRNFFVIAAVGLLLGGSRAVGLWPGLLVIPLAGINLVFPLWSMGLTGGAICGFLGGWMVYESKVGKLRLRERLLDQIAWTGGEQVLDVGCGRGLMLIGAAKRLLTGKATGIDIWQAEDLTNNHADAVRQNARREGVADRLEVKTADMRRMPFPDASFDVVVSRAAIHNLYQAAERAEAVGEIARVLKPGGVVLIDDIRHRREYTAILSERGCTEIRRLDSRIISGFLAILTLGSVQPMTLLGRKRSSV